VAINRCRDLTRAAHQKDTELDENLPAPEQMEDGSVLDAVKALPENYRNAIYLHYYEGYTTAEIGRMLKVPTNTVLSWLRRARAQLQTMLKEEIEDEVV
jgi:RNA polymerase sigma-70 factor (ECF subfamily)